MDLQLIVDDKKAKRLLDFLNTLDYVEVVEKKVKPLPQKVASKFSYFGLCKDWQEEASALRKSSHRNKATQW